MGRSEEGPWTDDRITQLRCLWTDGVSTAEIGRRLGVSKNAIIGKAHRLDLPAREDPIRQATHAKPANIAPRQTIPKLSEIMTLTACVATPTVPEVPAKPAPTITRPPVATRSVPAPAPARCQPMRIGTKICCWPIGDPTKTGFRFCEEPAAIGKPYCPEHVKDAYQPRQQRNQREHATPGK